MNATPIYQLGYFIPNMTVGNNLDLDKNRFETIENQLQNVYNIFGNGILAVYDEVGKQVSSWLLSAVPNEKTVQVSTGKGHIAYKYTETNVPVNIPLVLPSGVTSGTFIYYFYATANVNTPVDKSVDFISSLTQIEDPVNYVGLGAASLYINPTDGSFSITVYNTAEYGRQEISLFSSLTTLVKNHLHIGGPNNPSPIDLGAHVTGFLSSSNIDQLDLNKVASGTLDPNRLPLIDHNSLLNIGTLTHEQIDSLLAELQYPGENYNLSDYGIVNRLQIILALKKQTGFFNIDGEQLNSIFYMPYTKLNDFVDYTNGRTTAVVNNEIHRVYGTTGLTRQSNVIKINTTQDFNTALFYAEDAITNPRVSNIEVTGVTTTSTPGTINMPYGLAGSATTVFVAGSQDSFVSSFSTNGTYINRRIDFDPNLNLNSPLGLHYDQTTNYLYIADTFNHRILVSNASFSSLIAKIGANNATGVPGPGSGNGFNYPKGVFGLGNTFYVSDSGNNEIQKFQWQGGIPVYQTTYKFSNSTITGIDQGLNDPRGLIATSHAGNNYLFVADYNNHRVLCGYEISGKYQVYQQLGNNSAGLGVLSTSLITFTQSSNVTGVGAGFTFATTLNGSISTIGIASAGTGYNNLDTFIFNYNGNTNGLFTVQTDGAGKITKAFATYGVATNSVYGFNHPQGLAVSSVGNSLRLLISDTDNNRLISYNSLTVGVGTTSNQMVYSYSFGTSGSAQDTNLQAYLNRPAGIYAQQGFSTVFVADSLNNRIHGLTTSFSRNSFAGFSTTQTFGVGDTALTEGGITLTQPIGYVGIANTSLGFVQPVGWYIGEIVVVNSGNESDDITRYNYVTFAAKTFSIQDTLGVAINTLRETATQNLGQISCYLIFADNFSGGNKINFNLTNNTARNSINISNTYVIRPQSSTLNEIYEFVALSNLTTQPNPSIIGFGFVWSTLTGWTNNDALKLNWYLPEFNTNALQTNFPKVLNYRKKNGLNNPVFAFNTSKYSSTGIFVFRFDSGVGGSTTFDYAIFNYATPYSERGQSSIQFYYRVADTLEALNSNNQRTQLYPSASGASVAINNSGRFIDLIFYLNASTVDQLTAPVISSISLYYTAFGANAGIIYDTNVNNAPLGAYPRFKWSQGTSFNISVLPVANNNNQAYQIKIDDTSQINKYLYLSTNNLELASGTTNASLGDINNNFYLSPYQAFAGLDAGMLNPQHYVSNGSNGYFIADTGNDRVIEIDSNGLMTRAIQGNITLTRCDRAFAILNVFYNSNTKQIYATFSQYLLLPANYLEKLSIYVNGFTYLLSNPTYFNQNNIGLFAVNANNRSAVFFATVTNAMDAILTEYVDDIRFQIQNSETDPPFQVPTTGRSDGNDPETETITYDTSSFNEFVYNAAVGVGTILNFNPNTSVTSVDPITFGTSDETSTVLWSYWQGTNQFPNFSNFYSIPVQVFPIYFDNIFKPLHLDFTEQETLVVSTVGNNAIRAYDSNFNFVYKISIGIFNFNEKLGGSTVVLDRSSTESGNVLLVAQPGISTENISGKLYVYNRNSASIINQYTYNNFDAVKAYPQDDNYLVLLNDRIGGIRSKLIRIAQDGTSNFTASNIFTRPVSLDIQENNQFYVTDITGQYGTIYFRTFVADGSGNSTGTSGLGSNTGSGGSSQGGNTGGTAGGNAGGNTIGGGDTGSGGISIGG